MSIAKTSDARSISQKMMGVHKRRTDQTSALYESLQVQVLQVLGTLSMLTIIRRSCIQFLVATGPLPHHCITNNAWGWSLRLAALHVVAVRMAVTGISVVQDGKRLLQGNVGLLQHCAGLLQHFVSLIQVSKEEVVQSLRKQSRGAQKTSSQYRGVTKHMKGKWEARIGQMVGRKYK